MNPALVLLAVAVGAPIGAWLGVGAGTAIKGRITLYLEPRDIWIGAYVAPGAVYICPLPCVVIKIRRGQ